MKSTIGEQENGYVTCVDDVTAPTDVRKRLLLTRRKSLFCIGLDEDLGNKWCVAVVNFFLEFQLRPRNILRVEKAERLRTTFGA